MEISSVNHISFLCKSLEKSTFFYTRVLGFEQVARPSFLTFLGVWLHGHGIGIHLLLTEDLDKLPKKTALDPKKNHIAFQCDDMEAAGQRLDTLGIDFVRQTIVEGEVSVSQIFFHDPDGYMIEICSCTNFPVVPIKPPVIVFSFSEES